MRLRGIAIKSILTNAGWSALSHVFERGSLVLASVILTNLFSTEEFAEYSYFQLTVSMIAAYASMGLGVAASKYFSESECVESNHPLLGTVWLLSIFIGFLFSIFVLLIPTSWLGASLNIPSWLFSLGVFSLSLSLIPNAGIIGLEKFKIGTISSITSAVIILIGSTIAGLAGSSQLAMLFFVSASLTQSSINTYIIFKSTGFSSIISSVSFNKANFSSIFKFSAPLLLVTLLSSSITWIMGRVLLMTNSEGGEYQFSLYAIGLQWLALALFIPGMITKVIFPKFVKARNTHNESVEHQTKLLMRSGVLYASLAAVGVCFSIILLGPQLILFYGEQYADQRWLIVWFALAALPMAPTGSIGNGIVASGKQVNWLLITLLWFISILICVSFLRSAGAVGMAISYGICSLLMFFMAFIYAYKKELI